MSISKRSLIFVFSTLVAFAFFARDHKAVAQEYKGLEMPDVYYLTPLPFKPNLDTNEAKRAYLNKLRPWKKENDAAGRAIRAGQSKVKEILASGGDVTADPDARKFLDEYSFPSMTQTDPDTLSGLGDKRQTFLKNYLNSRVTGSARSKMLNFTIDKLQTYSTDSTLHPSARVNAIVLLSQLTDRPLARGQAPVASANAIRSLMTIFTGADPKQNPEFVKVAAFSGITNLLELNSKSGQSVDTTLKNQLLEAAMKFMAAPADREQNAAAYWNKRQSIQLSALLKDAKTVPALLAILNDEAASHELKLEVVRTIGKTGPLVDNAKAKTDVLVAICKFAGASVAGEATHLQDSVNQMVRNNILYGDEDLRVKGADFEPTLDERAQRDALVVPLLELPNYELAISRNRLRAVSKLCQEAIGTSKENGLRQNLDTKAEALANSTVRELSSLMRSSGVGLYDLEARRRATDPEPEDLDNDRKESYVNQMIKVCNVSADALAKQLTSFTAAE